MPAWAHAGLVQHLPACCPAMHAFMEWGDMGTHLGGQSYSDRGPRWVDKARLAQCGVKNECWL